MNKNAIKNYAVWARTELMKQVAQKAYEYDVTESSLPGYNTDNVNGRLLTGDEKKQLNELIREVKKNGYEHVIEEVAYTWFNRFIALRYMEVNNYLPQRIRVFTNDNNEFKPDLLTDAIHVELDGLDKQKVFDYIEENKQEELYKYLLLTLCNDMNLYLPDMFTSIKDYKTLLFPDNLLKEDSVLAKLITDIDEDSWTDQVQIIGWLYQYYNSELKDIVMKKKNYTKDDIPAVTQLFTPDWIVRYMTENSLGRLWLDGHPDFDHSEWKYYLEEAKQEPEVIEQLNKIKEEHAKLRPDEIKVIDPCMGSGHILVYAFDVLMDIYRDAGYSDRDAAKSILENNLYGLEIDERAYHLAYFALMMKARSYNRRILNKETKFNLVEIREPIAPLKKEHKQYLDKYVDLATYLVDSFKDGKELGSIINLDCTLEELNKLKKHVDELSEDSTNKDLVTQSEISELNDLLKPLIKQAKLLVQKYDVVITNPPYMAPDAKQKPYVQKNYSKEKKDLCVIFIDKALRLIVNNGYASLITMESWMFLSSFEDFRKKLLKKNTIINMVHMPYLGKGRTSLGINFGTQASILSKNYIKNYNSQYEYTVYYECDENGVPYHFPTLNSRWCTSKQDSFCKIPGSPIAYWVSKDLANIFAKEKPLVSIATPKQGLATTDNNKFIRLWPEVNIFNIGLGYDGESANKSHLKWFPINKGGDFRKWYGNNENVVNYQNDGAEIKKNVLKKYTYLKTPDFVVKNQKYYFKENGTWSAITSGTFSVRYSPKGYVISNAGMAVYASTKNLIYIISFLNSKCVTQVLLKVFSQTLNFNAGDIEKIPLIINENSLSEVNHFTNDCIKISKSDWDSFETSWDFELHPLVKSNVSTISEAYNLWNDECESRFNTLKSNEEELNRIFIDIYGLQDELDPYEEDKDVTVRRADLVRDIKSFISYAVGCMFGRYSLDVEGLAYAGGEWDSSKYSTFIPDADDIIPICDEEYFEDDIVTRFVEFVRVVYGSDTLEDNLSFIANALGGKGNPRDVLRDYFLNGFFKDHCNTYQVTGSGKRPIYWLFDSGKKNGFKALVYIHRYAPDLIARMRTGYIHPQQARYRTQVELLQSQIDDASSTSERVKLSKQLKKINEQLLELNKYEEVVHHWADKMEPMDLDDGVKANYAKFQELLAKIK